MDRVKVKVKVDIKARETIKPSSPTPQNLKIFELSLLDQIAPPIYVPRILYYAYNGTKPNLKTQERIKLLKESLSQALTRIYPLAGRVKENLFIECNDEGADFLEAEVNSPLDEILRQPEVDVLDLLLPRDYETQLAVQVNIFSCEGMAIGICMFHRIVDGATFSSFVNMWAAIASRSGAGDSLSARAPIFPGPRLFPQRDISALVPRFDVPKGNCITKRFVFPGSKIASLKEKVVANNAKDGTVLSPTRNELVSALIWRCAMEAKSGHPISPSIMTHAVNLRPKMDLPLPDTASGNISWLAIARTPSTLELHDLVNAIRNAVKKVDKDYTRQMQGENGLSLMSDCLKEIGELVPENVEVYRFVSWAANLQLYEADFGWGKPIWESTAGFPFKNVIIFIETRVGYGLEAWVSMDEQDMTIFEQSQELRSFVSSDGNV